MSIFSGPVEKRVMSVMKFRIANAEKTYETCAEAVDEQCDKDIDAIEERREIQKTDLADKLVSEVLGR